MEGNPKVEYLKNNWSDLKQNCIKENGKHWSIEALIYTKWPKKQKEFDLIGIYLDTFKKWILIFMPELLEILDQHVTALSVVCICQEINWIGTEVNFKIEFT